eukprot:m.221121 g.221121  ORF g.221121 m.221121 type:complete len:245 (-) comp17244_c0_seq5:979-1713(-)
MLRHMMILCTSVAPTASVNGRASGQDTKTDVDSHSGLDQLRASSSDPLLQEYIQRFRHAPPASRHHRRQLANLPSSSRMEQPDTDWLNTSTPNPWTVPSPAQNNEPSPPRHLLDLSMSDDGHETNASNAELPADVPHGAGAARGSSPVTTPTLPSSQQWTDLEERTRRALAESDAFLQRLARAVPAQTVTRPVRHRPFQHSSEPVMEQEGDILYVSWIRVLGFLCVHVELAQATVEASATLEGC